MDRWVDFFPRRELAWQNAATGYPHVASPVAAGTFRSPGIDQGGKVEHREPVQLTGAKQGGSSGVSLDSVPALFCLSAPCWEGELAFP